MIKWLFIALVIASALLLWRMSAFASRNLPKTGGEAPDFALKSASGSNLRLSEYRGDVVMINFWATWCGPCRQEMPLLNDLYARYNRVGFSLLGYVRFGPSGGQITGRVSKNACAIARGVST